MHLPPPPLEALRFTVFRKAEKVGNKGVNLIVNLTPAVQFGSFKYHISLGYKMIPKLIFNCFILLRLFICKCE